MQEGVVYEIPRDLFLAFCESRTEMWRHLFESSTHRQASWSRRYRCSACTTLNPESSITFAAWRLFSE
jgi:hypothetical protein